jgi:uncharacterized iron-regulated membrane protein
MTRHPTDAERVDQAVNAVLEDHPAALPPVLANELAAARALRSDLHLVPPGNEFEEALAERLMGGELTPSPSHRVSGFVRHHQRLVLTGAVGSLVVSTAGAAVIAWRLARR